MQFSIDWIRKKTSLKPFFESSLNYPFYVIVKNVGILIRKWEFFV